MKGTFTDLILISLDKDDYFKTFNVTLYIRGGFQYEVEEGFETNLASIPRVVRGVFNRMGKSRKPAVFHDHMYSNKWETRKRCDQELRHMLIDRGMSKWKANLYYAAVRSGGWTRGNW